MNILQQASRRKKVLLGFHQMKMQLRLWVGRKLTEAPQSLAVHNLLDPGGMHLRLLEELREVITEAAGTIFQTVFEE